MRVIGEGYPPARIIDSVTAVRINRLLILLGFLGLFVAGILSLEKALDIQIPCGPGGGCAKVANDPSGYWFDIPVAYYGAVGYLILSALATVRGLNGMRGSRPLVTAGLVVSGIGAGASVFLQYVALVVLKATCVWCLASAAIMIATFVLHLMLSRAPVPDEEPSRTDGLLAIGGMVAVMVGLIVASSVLTKNVGLTTTLDAAKDAKLVPPSPHFYGNASAPVTIVEFSDICCPTCQKWTPKLHALVDNYPGRLRLIYRHLPIAQLHETAPLGAAISEIAAESGKFWPFLLETMALGKAEKTTLQDYLTIAGNAGVNPDVIKKRLGNQSDPIFTRMTRDMNDAIALGVNSTPTFFVMVKGEPTRVTDANGLLALLDGDPYAKLLKDAK